MLSKRGTLNFCKNIPHHPLHQLSRKPRIPSLEKPPPPSFGFLPPAGNDSHRLPPQSQDAVLMIDLAKEVHILQTKMKGIHSNNLVLQCNHTLLLQTIICDRLLVILVNLHMVIDIHEAILPGSSKGFDHQVMAGPLHLTSRVVVHHHGTASRSTSTPQSHGS